ACLRRVRRRWTWQAPAAVAAAWMLESRGIGGVGQVRPLVLSVWSIGGGCGGGVKKGPSARGKCPCCGVRRASRVEWLEHAAGRRTTMLRAEAGKPVPPAEAQARRLCHQRLMHEIRRGLDRLDNLADLEGLFEEGVEAHSAEALGLAVGE